MAQNKKRNIEKKNKPKTTKNPANTIWGKIIIWTLAIAMIAGTVGSLIYGIIQIFKQI